MDEDRRRGEGAQGTEEVVRHTGEVEVGVEVRDREAAEVEVVAVVSEIATMTGRTSDHGAILAADHHR